MMAKLCFLAGTHGSWRSMINLLLICVHFYDSTLKYSIYFLFAVAAVKKFSWPFINEFLAQICLALLWCVVVFVSVARNVSQVAMQVCARGDPCYCLLWCLTVIMLISEASCNVIVACLSLLLLLLSYNALFIARNLPNNKISTVNRPLFDYCYYC